MNPGAGVNVTTLPTTELMVPFTAPNAATGGGLVTPVMKGVTSIGVAVWKLPATVAVVGDRRRRIDGDGDGRRVWKCRRGPVAVYVKVPVPKKPAVGVNVITEPATDVVPLVEPVGVDAGERADDQRRHVDHDRRVERAWSTLVSEVTGAAVTSSVTVRETDVPPGPLRVYVNVVVPVKRSGRRVHDRVGTGVDRGRSGPRRRRLRHREDVGAGRSRGRFVLDAGDEGAEVDRGGRRRGDGDRSYVAARGRGRRTDVDGDVARDRSGRARAVDASTSSSRWARKPRRFRCS